MMIKTFLFLPAFFLVGCVRGQDANQSSLEKERAQLKDIAFCNCLRHCLPNGDSLLIADGTSAAYFELGSYSIDVYPSIDSLAKQYGKAKYQSKTGKTLCLMKCLNFYNSEKLTDVIKDFDNEINTTNVQRKN